MSGQKEGTTYVPVGDDDSFVIVCCFRNTHARFRELGLLKLNEFRVCTVRARERIAKDRKSVV